MMRRGTSRLWAIDTTFGESKRVDFVVGGPYPRFQRLGNRPDTAANPPICATRGSTDQR